jgi:MarR family transcriptional regulator for hemolysin
MGAETLIAHFSLAIECVCIYIDRMKQFEQCLNLELRKANRVISQIYDGFLSQCGLKTSQFSILRAIKYLQNTTNSELQDTLVLDQTSLSRALKPLIRDGYIEVRPGADRRQKQLVLSSQGKVLYKEAEGLWQQAQSHVAGKLGAEAKQSLLEMSDAVVALKA